MTTQFHTRTVMVNALRSRSHLILVILSMFALVFMCKSAVLAQTTYTWTAYNNATAGSATFETWGNAANWDAPNGVFVSGATNELMIFDDTNPKTYATGTNQLEQEGSITITGVPSLTMGTLTLDGRGPNNPLGTAIITGDNTATWTIGNGTTGTVNLTATNGGGGQSIDGQIVQDRYANHTVNPNITLAQTTDFTGNGGGIQGFDFTGNITDGGSGYGINKTGSSRLVLSGTNAYSGATTVSGGLLRLNSAGALPTNSALTLNNGTLELAAGDFTRDLGAGSNQFRITGGTAGFSAKGGPRVVTVNNDASQEVVWGSADFSPSTLMLNSNTADSAITFANDLDLGASNRNVNVTTNTAKLTGDIQNSSGTAGINKNGVGTLVLTGANTYNGNTQINSGTVSIETSNNAGVGGGIIFNGGTLGIRGTTLTQLSGLGHAVTINANKNVGFDIEDKNNTFTADIALTQGTGRLYKYGAGTLVLNQANTYSGETTAVGGGNLVLDYSSQDNSKLSDTTKITLGGTTLTLTGGSHSEDVLSTTLTDSTASTITRSSGTATINLNAISKGNRSVLNVSENGIATTDTLNDARGILGGFATVGSHWAINQTNAADGAIVAYSGYTPFVTSSPNADTNYQLLGGATLTGGGTMNTLRIENTADDQVLDLGTNALSIRSFTTGNRGGLLYAGGANNNYTITGTGNGRLQPSNGNGQSLLINTYTGKLTLDAKLQYGSSGLTKAGAGTLALGGANSFSGRTDVLQGTLLINGDSSGMTGAVNVAAGSTLGGSGTIGGNLIFADDANFLFSLTDTLTANGSLVDLGNLGVADLVGLDGSVSEGTYTLIDGIAAFDFTDVMNLGFANSDSIGGGKVAYLQEGSLQVVVALAQTAVPEPTSLSLLGLGLLSLGLAWRRRRR